MFCRKDPLIEKIDAFVIEDREVLPPILIGDDEEDRRAVKQFEVSKANDNDKARNLVELAKAKAELRKANRLIDPSAVVTGVIWLVGTVLILNYEKVDCVRSKAIQFLPKLKF